MDEYGIGKSLEKSAHIHINKGINRNECGGPLLFRLRESWTPKSRMPLVQHHSTDNSLHCFPKERLWGCLHENYDHHCPIITNMAPTEVVSLHCNSRVLVIFLGNATLFLFEQAEEEVPIALACRVRTPSSVHMSLLCTNATRKKEVECGETYDGFSAEQK